MATIGRALPISTVLPRPAAAEGLVAEPADPPRLLPAVVPHTRPARGTTVAGQATVGLGRCPATGRARLPTVAAAGGCCTVSYPKRGLRR
ncbi:hypothetical protein LUW77_13245 [Streptomyces radiopugnans]|nr:hypothetical protein LUW77_13245 [Streptomyces radiopugnans]